MNSKNPALKESIFQKQMDLVNYEIMTLDGTINKTGVLFLLLALSSFLSWKFTASAGFGLFLTGFLGGIVLSLVTIFVPKYSPFTAPLYAIFEGLVIGGVSYWFEASYPGIVVQAVILTFGVFGFMVFAYWSRWIKPTENMRMMIVSATGAIALVYVIDMVLAFFGTGIPVIHESGVVGIIFSLLVVGVAAMNFVLDFDFIERSVGMNLPKYMEWYAGFGLLLTMVWLYLEILRLLSKARK